MFFASRTFHETVMKNLASRTKPGPSFQVCMRAYVHTFQYLFINKTAYAIVERSAQTTFTLSPKIDLISTGFFQQKLLIMRSQKLFLIEILRFINKIIYFLQRPFYHLRMLQYIFLMFSS
jgi:hypothetical protein